MLSFNGVCSKIWCASDQHEICQEVGRKIFKGFNRGNVSVFNMREEMDGKQDVRSCIRWLPKQSVAFLCHNHSNGWHNLTDIAFTLTEFLERKQNTKHCRTRMDTHLPLLKIEVPPSADGRSPCRSFWVWPGTVYDVLGSAGGCPWRLSWQRQTLPVPLAGGARIQVFISVQPRPTSLVNSSWSF